MRQIDSRVVRQLNAADGYLELGMPAHALRELATVQDAGPLKPAVAFMTGLALKDQHQYDEAIEILHRAATEIPAPHNSDAWRMLGECYRITGEFDLAGIAEMFADDPGIPTDWDAELACLEETDAEDESSDAFSFQFEWGGELSEADRFPLDLKLPK